MDGLTTEGCATIQAEPDALHAFCAHHSLTRDPDLRACVAQRAADPACALERDDAFTSDAYMRFAATEACIDALTDCQRDPYAQPTSPPREEPTWDAYPPNEPYTTTSSDCASTSSDCAVVFDDCGEDDDSYDDPYYSDSGDGGDDCGSSEGDDGCGDSADDSSSDGGDCGDSSGDTAESGGDCGCEGDTVE